MEKKLKLLVLEGKKSRKDRALGFRIDRIKALNSITESGAKVSLDSGGRLIVVEVPEKTDSVIKKSLPGSRLLAVNSALKDEIQDLDENESLFLDALRIRNSKSYIDAKKKRKPGQSPEEKLMFSASCVREGY